MSFYESISTYYDDIFPASPTAAQFLMKRARPPGTVLDLACGTGNHALMLAQIGCRVTGVDLDKAMIAHARRKKEAYGDLRASFSAGDMRAVGALLDDAVLFDLVYCIGNSLPHLRDEHEVLDVLRTVYGLTSEGGNLVVQIVNFERLKDGGIVDLPTIQAGNGRITFERAYEQGRDGGHVLFQTRLTVRESSEVRSLENEVPLLVLSGATLERLVREAGYADVEMYGDFEERPYEQESAAVVLSARKR